MESGWRIKQTTPTTCTGLLLEFEADVDFRKESSNISVADRHHEASSEVELLIAAADKEDARCYVGAFTCDAESTHESETGARGLSVPEQINCRPKNGTIRFEQKSAETEAESGLGASSILGQFIHQRRTDPKGGTLFLSKSRHSGNGEKTK